MTAVPRSNELGERLTAGGGATKTSGISIAFGNAALHNLAHRYKKPGGPNTSKGDGMNRTRSF